MLLVLALLSSQTDDYALSLGLKMEHQRLLICGYLFHWNFGKQAESEDPLKLDKNKHSFFCQMAIALVSMCIVLYFLFCSIFDSNFSYSGSKHQIKSDEFQKYLSAQNRKAKFLAIKKFLGLWYTHVRSNKTLKWTYERG